ncbi:MAG: hypothetical protein ACYDEK_11270 [Vulcanimicrobiaceae bacterium]
MTRNREGIFAAYALEDYDDYDAFLWRCALPDDLASTLAWSEVDMSDVKVEVPPMQPRIHPRRIAIEILSQREGERSFARTVRELRIPLDHRLTHGEFCAAGSRKATRSASCGSAIAHRRATSPCCAPKPPTWSCSRAGAASASGRCRRPR